MSTTLLVQGLTEGAKDGFVTCSIGCIHTWWYGVLSPRNSSYYYLWSIPSWTAFVSWWGQQLTNFGLFL